MWPHTSKTVSPNTPSPGEMPLRLSAGYHQLWWVWLTACTCTCTLRMCHTMGVVRGDEREGLSQDQLEIIYHALLMAMGDYTTDARGDIGVV